MGPATAVLTPAAKREKPRSLAALQSGSFGAGNRTRTGDIDLGKVALYQLSYARERRRRVVSGWGAVKLAPLSRPLTAGARFLFLRTLHADAVRVQFAIQVRTLHAEGV